MNNDVHEIKQLDGTRIGFILKGIVVGILVGFVVSLFRLGIEKIGEQVVHLYQTFHEKPFWMIPWFLFSLVLAYLLGRLIKRHSPSGRTTSRSIRNSLVSSALEKIYRWDLSD